MSLKSFKIVGTSSADLSRVQDNIVQAIEPLIASKVVDGILVQGVVLDSAKLNVIFHKLGRELMGWTVVGQDANAVVWDEQAANPLKSKTLRLQCSADVTVNLWVF